MSKYQSISVTDDYFKRIDLSLKKEIVLENLKKIPQLSFSQNILWESRYWGKGIGAFLIEGFFKIKNSQSIPVIIKIQGAKPLISEAKILEKLNFLTDKNIRFPKVIFYKPWDKNNQYEIIIFEKINADFIINQNSLATKPQINEFFYSLKLYKKLARKVIPFLKKPKEQINYFNQFLKWRQIRFENKLQFLINKKDDQYLLTIAKKLDNLIKNQPIIFQHCHLSVYDIKKLKNKYYLFSNLFWGYKWPYYDVVFGFMWYILGIAQYKKEEILYQINIWEKYILNLNKNDNKIIIAIIERYLAALNLDILMINRKEEIIKTKKILFEKLKEKLNLINI